MTAKEVSERYGYSVSTIQTKFLQTAASIKKKYGITIVKLDEDNYAVDDNRAKYFYLEKTDVKKGIHINKDILKLDMYNFIVLLGVLCTPKECFNGTVKQLAGYLWIPRCNKAIAAQIEDAIYELVDKKYIKMKKEQEGAEVVYYLSKYIDTNGDFWFAFDVGRVNSILVQKAGWSYRRFVNMIKSWIAMTNQQHEKKFYYANITKLTGLSHKQIYEAYVPMWRVGLMKGIKRYQSYFKFSFDDAIENQIEER